jgi:hypothetical protein
MRIRLNPNRAANPLVWLLLLSVLLSIGGSIYHGLNPHGKTGDRPPPPPSQPKAETPQTLMQGGYQRLKRSGNQVSLDTTGALARNYLDEANRQNQPLIWIRTEYNNTLAELKDWQNAKVEYATGEAEKLASLQIKAAALAMLMNAIAQDKTGKLDKSIDLQKLTQEGDAFFSLYDSKIIEQRYPMP